MRMVHLSELIYLRNLNLYYNFFILNLLIFCANGLKAPLTREQCQIKIESCLTEISPMKKFCEGMISGQFKECQKATPKYVAISSETETEGKVTIKPPDTSEMESQSSQSFNDLEKLKSKLKEPVEEPTTMAPPTTPPPTMPPPTPMPIIIPNDELAPTSLNVTDPKPDDQPDGPTDESRVPKIKGRSFAFKKENSTTLIEEPSQSTMMTPTTSEYQVTQNAPKEELIPVVAESEMPKMRQETSTILMTMREESTTMMTSTPSVSNNNEQIPVEQAPIISTLSPKQDERPVIVTVDESDQSKMNQPISTAMKQEPVQSTTMASIPSPPIMDSNNMDQPMNNSSISTINDPKDTDLTESGLELTKIKERNKQKLLTMKKPTKDSSILTPALSDAEEPRIRPKTKRPRIKIVIKKNKNRQPQQYPDAENQQSSQPVPGRYEPPTESDDIKIEPEEFKIEPPPKPYKQSMKEAMQEKKVFGKIEDIASIEDVGPNPTERRKGNKIQSGTFQKTKKKTFDGLLPVSFIDNLDL